MNICTGVFRQTLVSLVILDIEISRHGEFWEFVRINGFIR